MSLTFMEKFDKAVQDFPKFQELSINSFPYKLMYITSEELEKWEGNEEEFIETLKNMVFEIHKIYLSLVLTLTQGDYSKAKKLLSLLHKSEEEWIHSCCANEGGKEK